MFFFLFTQRNVKALIDLLLEKFKNLWEESGFYWEEIIAGTHKFDRFESEVSFITVKSLSMLYSQQSWSYIWLKVY
jgi:secreted Zn-dependent insulinase-like peptidase